MLKSGFGLHENWQKKRLEDLENLIGSILPCQTGFLISMTFFLA